MTGVQYPALYEDFLAGLDLVNLNFGFILSFACVLETDHYQRLLFATIGPMVVFLGLAMLYSISKKRNYQFPEVMRSVNRKFLSIALFIVFFVYSSVSHTIFQTFVCEKLDNDIEYLRADYSLECTTSTHKTFEAYAAVMVIIYPIGIPVTFLWWLLKNRRVLSKRSHPSSYSDEILALRDLWGPYKPQCYYFEFVEYARRVLLTGVSVFVSPGKVSQIAVVLVVAVLFAMSSEALSPFRFASDAWLYRLGNCIIFLSMYLALLLKVGVSGLDESIEVMFSIVLIVAHAALVLVAIFNYFFWEREHRRKQGSSRVTPARKGGKAIRITGLS